MSTVYTLNGKVLKNVATDKWLTKKEAPTPPPGPSFQEVTIGTQTWTAEDLRIDDGQGGITTTQSGGYIYTAAAAARVASSISGWHLPTLAEFGTLANTVGYENGTNLMLNGAWMGATTNSTGFNGVPNAHTGGDGYSTDYAIYMLVESSTPVIEDEDTYWWNYGYLDYTYDDDAGEAYTTVGTGPNNDGWSMTYGLLRLVKNS